MQLLIKKKGEIMKKLNNIEMKKIEGGVSSSMINAILRGASLLYNMGQAIGSAIRRSLSKNYC